MKLPKIIVVLGPTASGKTDMGLFLAKKFNGEIISADSRQIYKEMDIGTAKPKGRFIKDKKTYIVDGIPHYLMDILSPKKKFSLADFKNFAVDSINDILSRNKLPIIVGGTGLYIWALVDNLDIPSVEPDYRLRKKLEKKKLPELVKLLGKIDPATAKKIDLKNPRRVLRALEVAMLSGSSFLKQQTKSKPVYKVLQIGLDLPREELYERINVRVDEQIKSGLVEEIKKLVKKYDRSLPSMSSIGYKQIGSYLREEAPLAEAVEVLKRDTRRYAKRQETWFKRDKRIKWIKNTDRESAQKLTEDFLAK